jgi:hypothetical protein
VEHSKLHPITNPLTVRIRGFGGLFRRRLISQPPRVASEPSALSVSLLTTDRDKVAIEMACPATVASAAPRPTAYQSKP